jgi:hypothetical protein
MMPHTVPSRPISGAVLPIVPSHDRFRSSCSRCSLSAICNRSSCASTGNSALRSTSAATGPNGCAMTLQRYAPSLWLPARAHWSASLSACSALPRRFQ